jgi:acyl dehydratase
MRAREGLELRIAHSIHNEHATRLAICKFADGIGDPNPLWRDPAYASTTRHGEIIAPPSWVLSVFAGIQFGWQGLGAFHSASRLRFHVPVCPGDQINPTCRYNGFTGPRPSRFAEVVVTDHFTSRYTNQADVVVSEVDFDVMRFARRPAGSGGQSNAVEGPHRWTTEQLAEIEEHVLAETPRGADVRWWEDVAVGDSIGAILKGPIGTTDEIAFLIGGGAPIPRLAAHRAALRNYHEHPAWAFRDPETGALEPIYAVHYNRQAAQAMGVAMQYDVGFQRQCWQIHLLTDWMGDDGWLKYATSSYRRFVYLSDLISLTGRVVAKYVDDHGDSCVAIQTTATNQRGQEVMPGDAVIALPRQDPEDWPADRRHQRRRSAIAGDQKRGAVQLR